MTSSHGKAGHCIYKYLQVLIAICCIGITPASAQPIKPMVAPASVVAKALDEGQGKRMALVLYASWCPFCRQVMPDIVKISADYPGQIVAVSFDKDEDTFARYLQKSFGQVGFTPYMWDRSDIFAKPLKRFGITPGAGIPFTALMDEYGYVHQQGVIKPEVTRAYLSGK